MKRDCTTYLYSEQRIKWIHGELLKYGLLYVSGDMGDLKKKITTQCVHCGEIRDILFRLRNCYGCRKKTDSEIRASVVIKIEKHIEKLGYVLTKEIINYTNSKETRLHLRCVNGHSRETTYANFLKNPLCKDCKNEKNLQEKFSGFRVYLSTLGYTISHIESRKYNSNTQYKIKASCPEGHTFNKLLSCYTSTCPICTPQRLWNFESISCWLNENMPHLILLYYDIKSRRASLKCSIDGYIFTTEFTKWKSADSDCPKCSKSAKLTKQDFLDVYEKEGYQIEISDTPLSRDKIKTTCPKGHIFFSHIVGFRDRKNRCPECQRKKQSSRGEKSFADWVESLGYCIIRNDRKILRGLEIDCYLPDYNIGIEYNGLYHHSSGRKIQTNKHYIKHKRAMEVGLRLFQFWEDEFITKIDIIKSMILVSTKHESVQRVLARKCNVKAIDKNEAKNFLNENHLQGFKGTNCLGLFLGAELVMVLTYGGHHRKKVEGVVLQRLVTKKCTYVVGGLSKLLKHVPRPILTWSDNLYSNGDAYKAVGFSLSKELRPDYQYFKNCGTLNYKRFSKQSMKKKPEEKLTGKTELQLRTEQRYYRIFDAGKKQWVLC